MTTIPTSERAAPAELIEEAIKRATQNFTARSFCKAYASSWHRLITLTEHAARAATPPGFQATAQDHALAYTAQLAVSWARDLYEVDATEEDVWRQVREEFDRAHRKHDGMTPLCPHMHDMDRASILLEEVGEVARALTPDAHTSTGHGGDLATELVQVATMATAWLARILEDGREGAR